MNDSYILTDKTIKGLYSDEKEAGIALELAQMVTVSNNPYKPVTYYDGEQQIDYLNVAARTIYELETHSLPELPDNPLTRAIESYFGHHTELYLHWLAHSALAPHSPILIPFLVSTDRDKGGTGKTLCSATIPTAIYYSVSTVSAQSMSSDWGDVTTATRTVVLNDIAYMEPKEWNPIYGKMRDETSQGQRRRKNMKFSDFVQVTDSYGITVSANWIPPLDPHDRRAWVILPQHLEYGDTDPVSKADADWLDVFAQEHLHNYYTEVSELMAHLRYLYNEHTNKFKKELYRKAPETKGRNMAIAKGKTYSEQIIYAIQMEPQELWSFMASDEDRSILLCLSVCML